MLDQITFQETKSANGDSILMSVNIPRREAYYQLSLRWATATPSRERIQSQNRLSPNRAWLVNHAGIYSGRWVALQNGVLLGVGESLTSLVDDLRAQGFQLPSSDIMLTTGF